MEARRCPPCARFARRAGRRILACLGFAGLGVNGLAAEHPFLIVRSPDYAELQALATRSPWREIRAAAISTSNGTTINATAGVRERAFALNKIMDATALAYLLDSANRDRYRDRFYTYLRYWDLAQSGNITKDLTEDSWDGAVPTGAAFFYTVVAMDILHNDPGTTAAQAAQRDGFVALMDRAGGPGQMGPGRFFTETPFEFHLMAHRAAKGIWALWKNDTAALGVAVDDYRRSWLDFITDDGVYREYSGYALARSGEPSRSHKHFFADVLVHTGTDPGWYGQPKVQKFYEWLGGYALMPNRWTWPIGDSSYTSYSGGYNSNFDRSERYSALAGRYGLWAKNGGVGVNTLFPYLLTPRPNAPVALEAPSRIFPDGGAWRKQPGGGQESLAAVLVNQSFRTFVGRYVFLTYALDTAKCRRNVLSVFFPRKSTQENPALERIAAPPVVAESAPATARAASFTFVNGVRDFVFESDGLAERLIASPAADPAGATVRAKFAIYRKLSTVAAGGQNLAFYFVAQGRSFKNAPTGFTRGFASDADITVHVKGSLGAITSSGTSVTFYQPGAFEVRLNGGPAPALASGPGFVRLTVPAGTHRLQFDPITTAPVIALQPSARVVAPGAALLLQTSASGATSYRWFRDGSILTGETGSSLFRDTTVDGDAGTYTVRPGNLLGPTLSAAATVTFDVAASRAANLSCRTFLAVGDVLIPGFTLAGTGRKAVLIRAVGPGLAAFGVSGVLGDPRFRVFRGTTEIAANDDWSPSAIGDAFARLIYRRLMTPEGGVRGGIESAEHPKDGEGSWQESWPLFAYAPDAWSSYLFVASAARCAFYAEGKFPEFAALYRAAAMKAMTWAEAELVRLPADYLAFKSRYGVNAKLIAKERNLAAADLFRLTGARRWHDLFLASFSDRTEEGAWVYVQTKRERDPSKVELCRNELIHAATQILGEQQKVGFRWSRRGPGDENWKWGLFSKPEGGDTLVRAWRLTGEPRFRQGMVLAAQMGLGANPNNVVYTSGLGRNPMRNVYYHDTICQGLGPPAGLVAFGPVSPATSTSGMFSQIKSVAPFFVPAYTEWPQTEFCVDTGRVHNVDEHTPDGSSGQAAYLWGSLAY